MSSQYSRLSKQRLPCKGKTCHVTKKASRVPAQQRTFSRELTKSGARRKAITVLRVHLKLPVVSGKHAGHAPETLCHEFLQGTGLVAPLDVREVRLQAEGLRGTSAADGEQD